MPASLLVAESAICNASSASRLNEGQRARRAVEPWRKHAEAAAVIIAGAGASASSR